MKKYILLLITLLYTSCASNSSNEQLNSRIEPQYDCVMVQLNDGNYGAIKWSKVTGEAWLRNNNQWNSITEHEQLQESNYIVRKSPSNNDWHALRIDTINGITWQCISSEWIKK